MDIAERTLLLQGRMAAQALPRQRRIRNLTEVEFSVFSQWGEDGIIEWLVNHLELPNSRFVEFGVESFREASCRFLLVNRNWKGLVMDGDPENIRKLKADDISWRQDLISKAAFISRENINVLIEEESFGGEIALLSIDLDGNDYWIWESIDVVNPVIVICEFNALLGDLEPLSVPYDPEFERFKYHHSGAYFGSSLPALCHLAGRKGYSFAGTNLNGANAFFIRNDVAGPVLALLEEKASFPSRHRGGRKADGSLAFAPAADRIKEVAHLPVVNVVSGAVEKIGEIPMLYSLNWLAGMS